MKTLSERSKASIAILSLFLFVIISAVIVFFLKDNYSFDNQQQIYMAKIMENNSECTIVKRYRFKFKEISKNLYQVTSSEIKEIKVGDVFFKSPDQGLIREGDKVPLYGDSYFFFDLSCR